MIADLPSQKNRKGGKLSLAALLASAVLWASAVPATAEIVNSVVASGTVYNAPITAEATEEVDVIDQVATLDFDKVATFNDINGNGTADVGETISYSFTVTNTGNVTLRNVVLTDDKVIAADLSLGAGDVVPFNDSSDTPAAGWAVLAPGDTLTTTATYVLQLADLDEAQVINSARVDATTVPGVPVTATDSETTPFATLASMSMEKTGTLDLVNGVADVGDIITYQFKVTNTGPTTLKDISISDPLLNLAALPNVDQLQNRIQIAAAPFDPITTASLTMRETLGIAAREPAPWAPKAPEVQSALHVERRLVSLTSENTALKAGDRVGVYFKLTNAGQAPLTNISVLQPGSLAFGDRLDVLAPNTTDASSVLFTHELTAEDIETGQVELTSGIIARSRSATLVETLRGPMSLLDIETSDDIATASITPTVVSTLAPGAETTFTATYQITQADIDAGQRVNTAEATARGILVPVVDSATVSIPQSPAIAVEKTAALDLGSDALASLNDVITYTFVITNSGNMTLNDVQLTDILPNLDLTFTEFDNFRPGEERTFSGTYRITQVDIDAGKVENQATASGLPVGGSGRVSGQSDDPATADANDPTTIQIPVVPSIALIKEVDTVADTNNTGMTDVGDTVTYKFSVRNTGNTTLNDVYVQDRNAAVVSNLLPPTGITLDVGETDTTTFTATYELLQADIDRGTYDNTADVFGTAPDTSTVTDQSDADDFLGNEPTRLDIPAVGRIAVLKPLPVHIDNNTNGLIDLGDRLNYTITVTNLGNVTINNVRVTDPVANNLNITIPSLLPGVANQVSIAAFHIVDAADMTAGRVSNLAFAEGRLPNNTIVRDTSDPSSIDENDPTVTAITASATVALLKPQPQLLDTNTSGVTDAGDTLRYTFTVINTGNVDLTSVTVVDPLGPVFSTFVAPLEPDEVDNTSFTMDYVLTAADITLGRVVNRARVIARGTGDLNTADFSHPSNPAADGDTITYVGAPALAVVKTATVNDVDGDGLIEENEFINYAFTIRNVGSQPLTNITLTDVNATVSPAGGSIAILPVGESSTYFTGQHRITQADINTGFVQNQASAVGFFGPTRVEDDSHPDDYDIDAPTITPLIQDPGIAIVKPQPVLSDDTNQNGIAEPGEVLTYRFSVTNIGNVPLFDVVVTDNNADVVLGGPLAQLNPGQTDTVTFSATRQITPVDSETESITNQATVRAALSSGGALSETDLSDAASLTQNGPTITPIAPLRPALSKTAARSEVRRGETVAYTIAASGLGIGPYDIVDIMPTGFDYVDGSAKVNGVAATPAQSGQTLSFAAIPPTVQGRVTVTLTLRASASLSTGEFTNRGRIYHSPTGALLGEAKAVVKIKEEHVFDCGEIIGRVFDDFNNNGYMDEGEPGLPGVRVVTVNGLLVTTDKHGRFHVTCADIPDSQIGSNFVMKLDPRTLPAGYGLTTENPRDVRLTRGKITKLNFGASKRREVALDLTKDAFGKGLDLKPKFASGIDRLVSILQQGKGQLTITYRCGVYAPIADERLDAVVELLQAKWEEEGGNKPLKITKRVECGK